MSEPSSNADVTTLVDEFIASLWAGESPDPDEVVLTHPESAAELEEQLQSAIRLYQEIQHLPAFGRYRLAAQIGSGGSAIVYRAIDTSSRRTVALKVFPRTARADRFDRDVRALMRLKHPNIVQFLDTGIHDHQPYMALEMIEGGSLATRLAAGERLSPEDVVSLVIKLAGAVQYAHEQRVIHRDIKPGNILIGVGSEPQLTDFGLARHLEVEALTLSGDRLGTPRYMAPEQVRGDSHHADERTDVYGLGTVLYELLAGRPAFDSTDPVKLARAIAEDLPTPPSRFNSIVPRAIEAVCLKCLEKEPGDRFQSAASLAEALHMVSAGQSQRLWLPSRAGRIRRWWRRQRRSVRQMILAVITLVGVCGVLGWTTWTFRERSALAEESAALDRRAAELANQQELLAAQSKARAELQAAVSNGWHALQDGRMGRLEVAKKAFADSGRALAVLPGEFHEGVRFELRSLFASSLAALDIERDPSCTVELEHIPNGRWPVALHPSGRWLALGTPNGPVRLDPKAVGNGTKDIPVAPMHAMTRLEFSSHGSFLAFCPANGGFSVWDGELNHSIVGPLAKEHAVICVAFMEERREVCVCLSDGSLRSFQIDDGKEVARRNLPAHMVPPTAGRFTLNSNRLAVGNASGKVRVFTIDSSFKSVEADFGAQTPVQALAWSADEKTLAIGLREGRIVTKTLGGGIRDISNSMPFGVDTLEFSPDGEVLFGSFLSLGFVAWDRLGRPLVSGPGAVVGFSRDAAHVALSESNSVSIANWIVPSAIRMLRGHSAPIGKLADSIDCRRLVSVDNRFEARVWDLDTFSEITSFQLPVGGFYPSNCGLAFSRGGRFVAFASGGPETAEAVIYDLQTRTKSGPWKLPGGYEHLAALDGERFRLVREEFVTGSNVLESVMYELRPGLPPERIRVIRRSEPLDSRRYFNAILTPDGLYYAWCGPRLPRSQARVEVFELPEGKLVHSEKIVPRGVFDASLTFEFATNTVWVDALRASAVTDSPESRNALHVRFWEKRSVEDYPEVDWWPRRGFWLLDGKPRVGISGARFELSATTNEVLRLRTGRRLALGDRDGTISIVDQDAVFQKIAEIEPKRLP